MPTSEILTSLSTFFFAIAVILFVVAVIFCFTFKVPSVIADLYGRVAKFSIVRICSRNVNAWKQGLKSNATNARQDSLTAVMQSSQRVPGAARQKPAAILRKKVSAEDMPPETRLLPNEDATAPTRTEVMIRIKRSSGKSLKMLDEVILVHTDEEIP